MQTFIELYYSYRKVLIVLITHSVFAYIYIYKIVFGIFGLYVLKSLLTNKPFVCEGIYVFKIQHV